MNNKIINEIKTCSDKIMVFDSNNIIFIYLLKDAFNQVLRTIYVTNNKDNNLFMIDNNDSEITSTINIDELNQVLSKHRDNFVKSIEVTLPSLNILDGYINEVYFKVDDIWYKDAINNLYYYDGNDLDHNQHLSGVLNLLDDVYDVLYKYNQQVENYFILCEPEDNE